MELLNFINSHPLWQTELAAAPYNLKISHDGDYYILSYDMIASDMFLHICQEARGAIFRRSNRGWICVCRAFDKFFNATEPYAATTRIDWDTARVMQKVDGSLIKAFYDKGEWHWATNGMVDARTATINDHTFYDLISRAVDLQKLEARLDPLFTYMFELTSPYNKCVVQYEGYKLWYLGRRSMVNFKEDATPLCLPGVEHPRLYDFHNLNDCIAAAENMKLDEEGFVVVDNRFNRIKIKGNAYLEAHKLRGNNGFSMKRAIELWKTDALDDFLSVCPEYSEDVKTLRDKITSCLTGMAKTYMQVKDTETDKDFALAIAAKPNIERAYAFARRYNKCANPLEFMKDMRTQTIVDAIA